VAGDSPDEELRMALVRAGQRSMESLTAAPTLLAADFPGSAVVWAVRSAEMFIKELLVGWRVEPPQTGDARTVER
jgi:hypothetical protein